MIWTFAESNGKNTDEVNLTAFKPTGKFYDDAAAVCKLLGVKVHPALRPVLWEKEKPVIFHDDEEEAKEAHEKDLATLKLDKHRLDKNSLKALFYILPTSTVRTLKFSNNGITPSQFDNISEHILQIPTIQTLFFDWNPIHKEDYTKLDKNADVYYKRSDTEPSRFAKFFSPESKLKIWFLRGNRLNDDDIKQICTSLKDNHFLKVIDISYNNITKASILSFKELIDTNKTIEFIGLAKNNLTMEDLSPLLDVIGKQPFPEEEAEAHIKKMKERDTIIEKNKKLKASKKPEEVVPLIDDIEQLEDGSWVIVKNAQILFTKIIKILIFIFILIPKLFKMQFGNWKFVKMALFNINT